MRVLQRGEAIATLSEVERRGDKLIAVWLGPLPTFEPGEQLEPWVIESKDGFRREEDIWLHRIWERGANRARVELGSEEQAPPWRRSGPEPKPPDVGERPGHRPRVLIVDDDADTRATLGDALAAEGFEIELASSGREALAKAPGFAPDVAIVDLIMPEMSGQEVCLALRRDPKLRSTRILVLSAAEDTRLAAAESDADGAIIKPFTLSLLTSEVRRLLGA